MSSAHIDITTPEFTDVVKSQRFYDRFRNDIGRRILYEVQLHDPIVVNHEASPETLNAILAHIQGVWTKLGVEDAHWSVVSTSQFKSDNIANSIGDFNDTGRNEMRNGLRILARLGISIQPGWTALEYGCGVGRVTRWLADSFKGVVGVDVSANHLNIARKWLADEGIENVSLVQVGGLADVEALPAFDFLYSKIVLQHNPPPVIARILNILLDKMRPGGVGIIQIPTYSKNYSFVPEKYVAEMGKIDGMEMHVLPQPVVFEIMARHHCAPLEVTRDHLVTTVDFVSTTFAFRKN